MNTLRIWVLRLGAIAATGFGVYLLYDAYQDLSWGHRAIAEAGSSAWTPGALQDRILTESSEKDRSGAASEHAGLTLLAAAFIMEGLAAVLGKLGVSSRDSAEKKTGVSA
jgi:hypothetical protein